MQTYEEIVMQAVSELMIKAMSEQRISDEKVSALTDRPKKENGLFRRFFEGLWGCLSPSEKVYFTGR